MQLGGVDNMFGELMNVPAGSQGMRVGMTPRNTPPIWFPLRESLSGSLLTPGLGHALLSTSQDNCHCVASKHAMRLQTH